MFNLDNNIDYKVDNICHTSYMNYFIQTKTVEGEYPSMATGSTEKKLKFLFSKKSDLFTFIFCSPGNFCYKRDKIISTLEIRKSCENSKTVAMFDSATNYTQLPLCIFYLYRQQVFF